MKKLELLKICECQRKIKEKEKKRKLLCRDRKERFRCGSRVEEENIAHNVVIF